MVPAPLIQSQDAETRSECRSRMIEHTRRYAPEIQSSIPQRASHPADFQLAGQVQSCGAELITARAAVFRSGQAVVVADGL